MKLGMLTACLPDRTLQEIADWAAAAGFEALEVAAWPDLGNRPFTATHLRVEDFTETDAERTRALFDQRGLTLSALAATRCSVRGPGVKVRVVDSSTLMDAEEAHPHGMRRANLPSAGQLMAGEITGPQYLHAMATLAARDAERHPLEIPPDITPPEAA
jgi:sugar phosphate isomerase/epimerase